MCFRCRLRARRWAWDAHNAAAGIAGEISYGPGAQPPMPLRTAATYCGLVGVAALAVVVLLRSASRKT
jgi:hypothetical protein